MTDVWWTKVALSQRATSPTRADVLQTVAEVCERASRGEVGVDEATALGDVLGRMELPVLAAQVRACLPWGGTQIGLEMPPGKGKGPCEALLVKAKPVGYEMGRRDALAGFPDGEEMKWDTRQVDVAVPEVVQVPLPLGRRRRRMILPRFGT